MLSELVSEQLLSLGIEWPPKRVWFGSEIPQKSIVVFRPLAMIFPRPGKPLSLRFVHASKEPSSRRNSLDESRGLPAYLFSTRSWHCTIPLPNHTCPEYSF